MPEYLSPGIYKEEFKLGAQPIEGVSTSTVAFVGIAEKGPLNKPTLVTNQKDFIGTFGGYIKDSYLAYAVDGFFRNGGKRCFIVRVASTDPANPDAAKKASGSFDNMRTERLMTINALNEGSWGDEITIKIDESSSGTTTLFLSSLMKDVGVTDRSIKLDSTAGLSKGSNIVIDDGIKKSDLIVEGIDRDKGIVNLKDEIKNLFKTVNTRVYAKIPSSTTIANVKSTTGFSAGTVVLIQQAAPPNSSPVYVTLKTVKQSENLLKWTQQISTDINGAACIDFKGIRKTFTLGSSPINSGARSIPKSNIVEPLDSLEKGDKVAFTKKGNQKETLTVADINDKDITFIEVFKNDYSPGITFEAMTSSKTTLFKDTYQAKNFIKSDDGKTASITFDNGVIGLDEDDWITLTQDSNSEDFQIESVSPDGKTIKLKSLPEEAKYKKDNTIVRFTLKDKNTIVITLPGIFSINDLVEIYDNINKKTLGLFKVSKINQNRITFEGAELPLGGTGTYDADITVKQWVATSVKSKEFKISTILGDNELVESYDKLSIDKTSDRYFAKEGVINKRSMLIEIKDDRDDPGESPDDQNDLPTSVVKNLLGGKDGISSIAVSDYVGTINEKDERTGIVALEPVDEISLLAIPDTMISFGGGNGKLSPDDVEQIQLAMIAHCEKLKDRFTILDPIKNSTVQEVKAWRKDNLDSKYAALYYPWIKVSDPIMAENSTSRFIPPSGHIAGIYARSDAELGVHKAPANEVISGVIELERTLTAGEQEVLNPDGVNCIRAFQGRGIRVWGARTISSDSLWKYINIRRLFIYIEKSIEKDTQWVVFLPNNEKLWARVRATITQFLTTIWKDGALMGTKVEEAFFVKCDRTTMTPDEIDNGKLVCIIGIAPVKPAEFVIFRLAQWQGGSAAIE